METTQKTIIKVQTTVKASVSRVWKNWTTPEDIVHWNYAIDTWHTPHAANDLKIGGTFNFRMEARDGSVGFDFGGVYDDVKICKIIAYTLGDGRKVRVNFTEHGDSTEVIETFEAENINPVEMQRQGWQAILDHFKQYVEQDKAGSDHG